MRSPNKKKITHQPPPENRKPIVPGAGRKNPNGGNEAGIDSAASDRARLHLLKFENKPLFEIQMLAGDMEGRSSASNSIITMIDTEAKQLQAIEDLWAIIKAQPKYKDLKSQNWSPDTSPIKVLHYLLRKLGPLADGNRWTVDTYTEGKKTRYRFVVYKFYAQHQVRSREVFLPLDFLPGLKKRDLALHDLIVDTIALVSRYAKIPLWDEDGDFSMALEELISAKNMTDELRENMFGGTRTARHTRQRIVYSTGPAAQYLQLIRRRMKEVTPENVKRQCFMPPKSERRRQLLRLSYQAAELALKKDCIYNHTFIPNYMGIEHKALTPNRSYKFIWSEHNNDVVKEIAFAQLNADEDEAGKFDPVFFSIAKPGQKLPPLEGKDFPRMLDEWIGWTEYLITRKYRGYFYKQSDQDPLTPSEHLLEQIELNETKKKLNERHVNK